MSVVDSRPGLDLISCIETMRRMECPKPTDPFVLLILQSLTLTTGAPLTSMFSCLQPLFRCDNVVNDGPGEVSDIPSVNVFWTPFFEVLVEASVVFVSMETCTFCGTPSTANINSAAHIQQLTVGVMSKIDKPFVLLLSWWQVDIPPMDCKPSSMVV